MNWSKVDQALEQACVPFHKGGRADDDSAAKRKAVFPGAVLLVAQGGEVLHHKAFGSRSLLPEATEMHEDVVFDIASLTKALLTTTLVMQFVGSGQLSVDRKVSRILQSFSSQGKDKMTVHHLLNHSSGYPAIIPFYKELAKLDKGERAGIMTSRGAVDYVYNEIVRGRIEHPSGTVVKYSDVGFILLGHILEVVSGAQPLDKLFQKYIATPLGLRSMGFVDLSKVKRRGLAPITDIIAPTADCPWRKRILCGEVHDDNAWAMGGVAAHAGLFSTALDVHTVASALIESFHGRSDFVNQKVVKQFWALDHAVAGSTWALGWDTPSAEGSSAGKYFSEGSVGHLGFTGCSLWIDPSRELDVVLLTNRIHPSTENNLIKEFRPKIHDLVMEALGFV